MADNCACVTPENLEHARVMGLPPSIYYIPNFITQAEERYILSQINSPAARWTSLSHRRLQAHPSALSAKNKLLGAPLPAWLSDPVIPRLCSIPFAHDAKSNIFSNSPHGKPNHVLINEYQPGQGIMPHEDGSAYYPVVATVSLGSSIILEVSRKDAEGKKEPVVSWRLLQEPRSLLITTEEVYEGCLHGIAGATVDENVDSKSIANWSLLGSPDAFATGRSERQTRTSLTFRDVLGVSNLGSRLKLSST